MYCPQCHIYLKCPCKSCKPKNWGESGLYYVEWEDEEKNFIQQCPLCRLTARYEQWFDWAWDKVRPQLVEQGILK